MGIRGLILALTVSTVLSCGLIWLVAAAILRLRRRTSFAYLLFFTIFYVYIVAVLNYTIFQFQSIFLLNYLSPNHLILKGRTVEEGINLVPLVTLGSADLKTSFLNILMLVPFGFGLPFITKLRMKGVVAAGALFSLAIELLQLLTGLMAHMTFRTADINDVIFNTVGAASGYMLFIGFMRAYQRVHGNGRTTANAVSRYIAERPQVEVS